MATIQKKERAKEIFVEYLRTCNMRVTPERMSIIEVITKHSGLFSIDELHTLMIREAFPVSTATLYNTIELLVDSGLVKCLRIAERQNALYRLDVGDAPHVYLVCGHCGSVRESSAKALSRYIKQYEFSSFAPQSFMLTVTGLCKKCRRLISDKDK